MSTQDMINAITSSLQTTDSNGEYANVILLVQAGIISSLPTLNVDQLQNMCTILGINYQS